jgi:dTDP-4-amino-4,6-dideoxygalactose transaminase
VTNDAGLAERCRKLHDHGRSSKFAHEIVGRNSRMDGLQAAILRVKLRHLDGWLAARGANAAAYTQAFAGLVQLPDWSNAQHTYTYHQYPLLVEDRTRFQRRMGESGIVTGVHYPFALPALPCYARFSQDNYPLATRLAREESSIPVHELLSAEDVAAVIAAVTAALQ